MRKGHLSPQLYHFENQESYEAAHAAKHASGQVPEALEESVGKRVNMRHGQPRNPVMRLFKGSWEYRKVALYSRDREIERCRFLNPGYLRRALRI